MLVAVTKVVFVLQKFVHLGQAGKELLPALVVDKTCFVGREAETFELVDLLPRNVSTTVASAKFMHVVVSPREDLLENAVQLAKIERGRDLHDSCVSVSNTSTSRTKT